MNVLSLPPSVSIKSYGERCFSSSLTGSSNVSETTQPEYSLPVTKTWTCFSASACTPLAANLSTNQLLISSICFCSVTGLIGSSIPCWHPQYLCSFPTTPFLLWHSSISNPLCQSKLSGQRSFAYQGYSLEQTPAQFPACVFHSLFQNCSKNSTLLTTKCVTIYFVPKVRIV